MKLLENNEIKNVAGGGLSEYLEVVYKRGTEEHEFLVFSNEAIIEQQEEIIEFCQAFMNKVLEDSANSIEIVGPYFREDRED